MGKTGLRASRKAKPISTKIVGSNGNSWSTNRPSAVRSICPVDIPQVFRHTPVDSPQEGACLVTSPKFFRALSI
jgi:hypothetical protein